MKKKIIGSDYDGTLNRGSGITEEDADAIARFRAAGGLFGIVTGRSLYTGLEQFLNGSFLQIDFIIALNGSQIVDGSGHMLNETPIDAKKPLPDGRPLLRALVSDIMEAGGTFVGITASDRRIEVVPSYPDGYGDYYRPHAEIDSFDTFLMVNTAMASEKKTVSFLENELRPRYRGYMNPLQNGQCIDIPAWGIDKGEGLSRYAALVGVGEDDIYCAGDNWNDLAMLTRFHGCAMRNGAEGVKERSEHIVDTISDVVALAMKD